MHAIVELLPVVCGFIIAQLFGFTKHFLLKNVSFILLSVILGSIVNWLSTEGFALVIVDILLTAASGFAFLLLRRYLIQIRT